MYAWIMPRRSASAKNIKTVGCCCGRMQGGPIFCVSSFFRPIFPLLAFHMPGLTRKETVCSHSRPSEHQVAHGFFFWLSTFFVPTFPGPIQDPPLITQSLKCAMKDASEPNQPTGRTSGLVAPKLEDVDPFDYLLGNDQFRPFVTSSPRGSSVQANASERCNFNSVFGTDASMERESFHDGTNSPEFLGNEGSTGTLVHSLGDGSPVPKTFSASPKIKQSIMAGTVFRKTTLSSSIPASCSVITHTPVKDNGVTAVPLHPQSPTSVDCTRADSAGLAFCPCISFTQTLSSNAATGTDVQHDISIPPTPEEVIPKTMTPDVRMEHNVRRMSPRDVVLGLLKRGPRFHIRSLSGRNGAEPRTHEELPNKPVGVTGQADAISDAVGSGSAHPRVQVSPQVPNAVTGQENRSGLASFIPPGAIEEGPTQTVYIEKVRRKVVAKTRLFEDAYKRATTGLRTE